jgi:ribonuclease Z
VVSIDWQVLGAAGHDNALLVQINAGQAIYQLLCDCGEVGLAQRSVAELQALDHLLLSHLHMDHISGFDALFRRSFSRVEPPMRVWGPPATAQIMQHRLRGFMWNLQAELRGTWLVHDIGVEAVTAWRFAAEEAFAVAHPAGSWPHAGPIIANADFSVTAIMLDHLTPSMGYLIRETPRRNIAPARLAALKLPPGAWLQQVKTATPDEAPTLTLAGQTYELAELRAQLLVETPGDALAYLTDFRLDAPTLARLVPALQGCGTLVCESQFRHADLPLARRAYHLTNRQAAGLARAAGVAELVLIHISERYRPADYPEILAEARAIFPNTRFPAGWVSS